MSYVKCERGHLIGCSYCADPEDDCHECREQLVREAHEDQVARTTKAELALRDATRWRVEADEPAPIGQRALCFDGDPDGYGVVEKADGSWYVLGEPRYAVRVTHWMPLPEAPREHDR